MSSALTRSTDESAVMSGQMQAVHDFIVFARIESDEAAFLRDDFIKRWDDLGWFDLHFPSQELFDEIKNRENQFWVANRPKEERASAANVVRNNPTDPRQLSGGVFPQDERIKDVKEPDIENLEEQIEEAKPFWPSWTGPAVIITALAGVGLGIAKVVSGLNPMALAMKFAKKG